MQTIQQGGSELYTVPTGSALNLVPDSPQGTILATVMKEGHPNGVFRSVGGRLTVGPFIEYTDVKVESVLGRTTPSIETPAAAQNSSIGTASDIKTADLPGLNDPLKLALSNKASGADLVASISTVMDAVSQKADAADVATALAGKATTAAMTAALAAKADTTTVNTALGTKVDTAALTAALALKADAATTQSALNAKAASFIPPRQEGAALTLDTTDNGGISVCPIACLVTVPSVAVLGSGFTRAFFGAGVVSFSGAVDDRVAGSTSPSCAIISWPDGTFHVVGGKA